MDSPQSKPSTPLSCVPVAIDRARLKAALAQLANDGVYIGTSSWKYPGWLGQLYDQSRYLYRNKFAETRFERDCLVEYAQVFKTVCVDAAFYRFPDPKSLLKLAAQVPEDFKFTFKVSDEITVKRFSNLPRFGDRAGQLNPNFLNPELFISAFLGPCETIRSQAGVLIFEFGRFFPADFQDGNQFSELLSAFLGRLPRDWRYGVEIRNKEYLKPDYFAMLARHGVAHVYNSWGSMPSVGEQIHIPGAHTTENFTAARFLLKPGRKYQEAVDLFSPYTQTAEVNEPARAAGAELIRHTKNGKRPQKAFIYINNRLEGNALGTILAMLEKAGINLSEIAPAPDPNPVKPAQDFAELW